MLARTVLDMNATQRRGMFALLIATLALLNVSVAHADTICCRCTNPSDPKTNICINTTASDCVTMPGKSLNANVKKLNCDQVLGPAQCKTDGGMCPTSPVTEGLYAPVAPKPGTSADIKPAPSLDFTLGVPIPGLTFANNLIEQGGYIYTPYFAQYVAAIYRYLIGLSVVAAAIMLVYGGFKYIVASSGAKVQDGKEIMTDAVIGLLLVLGAYTILATINPSTLSFQALRVVNITAHPWLGDEEGNITEALQGKPISVSPPKAAGQTEKPASTATFVLPKAICSGASCKDLCAECVARPDLPTAPGIATQQDLVAIPKSPGLDGTGQLRKEAVDALILAGKAAQSWDGGPYTIKIKDSIRPLSGQVNLACGKFCQGLDKEVGINVATPGGSIHGSGLAVDLELWKDTTKLVSCCTVRSQTTDTKEENAKLMQDIMGSVGWVRYCAEVWHFEWGTDSVPSRSKSCPWPPH